MMTIKRITDIGGMLEYVNDDILRTILRQYSDLYDEISVEADNKDTVVVRYTLPIGGGSMRIEDVKGAWDWALYEHFRENPRG